MKTRLLSYLDTLQASFWFKPSFMAFVAVALSFITVDLDRSLTHAWMRDLDWVYSGGAEGASAVLQTIASSMITIAGVVFSLTLVALSLASSQFGSRMLRNFMRDGTNQIVLGTFISTFLYCLLVLRTIRRGDEGAFVPHVSVTLGVVFALASLWMLIYFIHHVSVSIQADEMIARVGADLQAATDRLFPDVSGSNENARAMTTPSASPSDARLQSAAIPACVDGYLQLVDLDRLVHLATEADLVFHLERRPGHYIVDRSTLLTVEPGHRLPPALTAQLEKCFVIGTQRSAVQDIEFSIMQLVEIAVRALSPGINDPFTAIACIDQLGSAFARLARRDMPDPCRVDHAGTVRVTVPQTRFPDLVDAAFNPLRQHARDSVSVTLRLLETVAVVAAAVGRQADVDALRCHADSILEGATAAFTIGQDHRALLARYQEAVRVLETVCSKQ